MRLKAGHTYETAPFTRNFDSNGCWCFKRIFDLQDLGIWRTLKEPVLHRFPNRAPQRPEILQGTRGFFRGSEGKALAWKQPVPFGPECDRSEK